MIYVNRLPDSLARIESLRIPIAHLIPPDDEFPPFDWLRVKVRVGREVQATSRQMTLR